jgi:hypothetical protein
MKNSKFNFIPVTKSGQLWTFVGRGFDVYRRKESAKTSLVFENAIVRKDEKFLILSVDCLVKKKIPSMNDRYKVQILIEKGVWNVGDVIFEEHYNSKTIIKL